MIFLRSYYCTAAIAAFAAATSFIVDADAIVFRRSLRGARAPANTQEIFLNSEVQLNNVGATPSLRKLSELSAQSEDEADSEDSEDRKLSEESAQSEDEADEEDSEDRKN